MKEVPAAQQLGPVAAPAVGPREVLRRHGRKLAEADLKRQRQASQGCVKELNGLLDKTPFNGARII